jgi:hypothetical protein
VAPENPPNKKKERKNTYTPGPGTKGFDWALVKVLTDDLSNFTYKIVQEDQITKKITQHR